MNTQLQVLAKVLIELGVVILVLSNFCKHLQALLDNVLANDLQTAARNFELTGQQTLRDTACCPSLVQYSALHSNHNDQDVTEKPKASAHTCSNVTKAKETGISLLSS